MSAWTELLGEQVRTKDGNKPTAEALAGKKVVGLYFSAHWCPPCRGFTPFLSATYEDMVEEHSEFELVFVSADRDTPSFEEYFAEMPFKALPFENRAQQQALSRKFGVTGIPMLIFLNDKGEVITMDGRMLVAEANGDVESLWEQLTK
jgi:nucleoredoxin|uniref:Thioredoxin domain-containing protein n=1 Tax=Globisporangium ultimum (strain ATCC 200006 / CBS 805.95 / DAOM BR144) TaxID=431595 RepID=K3WGP7_GLOUD